MTSIIFAAHPDEDKKDAATSKRQNAAHRNATFEYNMPQSPENVRLSAKDGNADIQEVDPMRRKATDGRGERLQIYCAAVQIALLFRGMEV